MKYELPFNLLLVRLKGRKCNRHLAFWTKAELAFPNPGICWMPEATRTRDSSILPVTGGTASHVKLQNAVASTELHSYQKTNAWRVNKMFEHENSSL